jgi:hypothetical protein
MGSSRLRCPKCVVRKNTLRVCVRVCLGRNPSSLGGSLARVTVPHGPLLSHWNNVFSIFPPIKHGCKGRAFHKVFG